MKAIDRRFTLIINGTTQFVIPVFQRDYSWTEEQCAQLWSDVLKVGRPATDRAHFMGSVVYVPAGDSSAGFTRWLLIDGQQRVTTLTLLLIALKRHIEETGYASDTGDGPTAKRIDAYYLQNTLEDGDRRQKLVLRRRDRASLAALLTGAELPADASPRIIENYEFFREQLKEADPGDVYRGIGRLVIVDVTLDRVQDNPQLIFESLNSTGIDLAQADLIRNFLLMGLPEVEQTRLYVEYWQKIEALFQDSGRRFDSFARDYMALSTQASRQVRADEIYRAFRDFYDERSQELGGPEALLAEMLRYARYYAAFVLGTGEATMVAAALKRLSRLAETSAVLVLRLFECHRELGSMSQDEFGEAIGVLESYVFRRAICGSQSRGYWNRFAAIAYKLPAEDTLPRLKVELARQPTAYAFIRDDEFRRQLLERPIYNMRNCHFLLDRLENAGSKEPTDTSGYTVEHVLPQNKNLPKEWRDALGDDWAEVQREWVHRLGNLTLTGYNSTYSDRPFETKKEIEGGFGESSVRLNKYIREQPTWSLNQIVERGGQLAKRALEVWGPLHVDPAHISSVEHEELKRLAERRTAEAVPMSARARQLLELLRTEIQSLGEIIEKGESKSISYHADRGHAGEFFLEVLPRKHHLVLLLDADFDELRELSPRVADATEQKFFVYAKYSGGTSLQFTGEAELQDTMACVRRAFELARA